MDARSKPIGQLLLDQGHVTAADIESALQMKRPGVRIGTALLRIGALSEETLLGALAEQLDMPLVTDADLPGIHEIYTYMVGLEINFEWFLSREVVLWPAASGEIRCIGRDLLDPMTLETINTLTGVRCCLTYGHLLSQTVAALAQEHNVDSLLSENNDARRLKELAEEAPIVELVNNVLAQAVDAGASDIHVEPGETAFKIRLRIDGVLRDRVTQPIDRYAAVASRIKLISGLDIADRRLPQDGRITLRISGQEMDVRVSTAPCVNGESIVMRLLPKDREELTLDRLGLAPDHLLLMRSWAQSSGGIVLVTGPTGSGKSTTLHSALSATNDGIRKIITVEDPVEIQIAGITQIQAHAEIGYTFARALRAILRQDPDVIMIGEIRDLETAEIAIQSALSGHLVLSTLHTNDAISSFTRLIDMGVEPFLVAAPLKGVQAQRLVRKICTQCAVPESAPQDAVRVLAQVPRELLGQNWQRAVGCDVCHGTGYSGRMGIYQMVPVDEEMRERIVDGATLDQLRELAVNKGYRTLYQDGLIKASHGQTSVDEILRVVTMDEAA